MLPRRHVYANRHLSIPLVLAGQFPAGKSCGFSREIAGHKNVDLTGFRLRRCFEIGGRREGEAGEAPSEPPTLEA